jgi:4-methyl-5(b-hydroxyethyl)-thiazole monophosphate biosynthesis
MKRVLVFVANGSEEIETMCVVDVLRRAGATVTLASVEPAAQVTLSRGVVIVADTVLSAADEQQPWDAVVVPGGMPGAARIRDSELARAVVARQAARGGVVGAICAAPAVALKHWDVLNAVDRATCHPNFSAELGPKAVEDRVVTCGNVTTSRGPGTALEFALRLVSVLYGEAHAKKIAAPMVVHDGDV